VRELDEPLLPPLLDLPLDDPLPPPPLPPPPPLRLANHREEGLDMKGRYMALGIGSVKIGYIAPDSLAVPQLL
jgi:hypothetical protein